MAGAVRTTAPKRSARGTSLGLPRLLCLLGLLAVALGLQGCSLMGGSGGSEKDVEKLTEQVANAERKVALLQKKLDEEKDETNKAELQGELTKAQESAKALAEKLEKAKAASAEASKQNESDTTEGESDKKDDAAKDAKKEDVASALVQHPGGEDEAQEDDSEEQEGEEEKKPAHGGKVEVSLLEQHARRAAGASKRERATAMAASSAEAATDRQAKEGVKDAVTTDHGSESHIQAEVRSHHPSLGCQGEGCEIPEED